MFLNCLKMIKLIKEIIVIVVSLFLSVIIVPCSVVILAINAFILLLHSTLFNLIAEFCSDVVPKWLENILERISKFYYYSCNIGELL